MRLSTTPMIRLALVCAALLSFLGMASPAEAADMKFQGFLLWGTDDTKPPPDKNYKPADTEVQRKLKDLPIKWTNWFEVKRLDFAVPSAVTKEVVMSEKCQVRVRQLEGAELELALIGKGKEVVKRKQSLPKGEILFLGGNAPNASCWMVALKRTE